MGVHINIGYEKFPIQGSWYNKVVEVCFNYDTSKRILGRIVRDDAESPGLTIIVLTDGRYVLSTECQFSLVD